MIIEVTGFITGIIGVILAVYSIIKQRELDARIKEKEKLKMLSKQLEKDIIPSINLVIGLIKDPLDDEDASTQIQLLSQGIVSKSFDEQNDVINVSTEIEMHVEEKSKPIHGKEEKKLQIKNIELEHIEDVIKRFEEGTLDFITFNCILGSGFSYSLDDILFRIKNFFYLVIDLEREFGNLIDEFKPELIKNLKICIKEIYIIILRSAINSKEIEINTKKFRKTDDIGLWIYNKVIGRDELNPYLDKLLQSKAELEKFRETLIMTSYT
ncbi:MAG: hypothetical protein FIB08_00795 [Candidatus Methanoperedens sp.]|nr:hypothetical protein [Candidatus Methanoperedens sp.]